MGVRLSDLSPRAQKQAREKLKGIKSQEKPSKKLPYQPAEWNKTESLYAKLINAKLLAGEIASWGYDPKFRLAKRTYYTADFFVIHLDGQLEIIEVKGFLRDDAAVKYKVARQMYPDLKFRMVRHAGGNRFEDMSI